MAEVIAAEAQASRQPTAANLRTWGLAQLLSGQENRAAATLEHAYQASRGTGAVVGDLAATLMVRGLSTDNPRDTAEGLELLLARTEQLSTAEAFDRAFALEALGLREQAAAAWERYRLASPTNDWTAVAAERGRFLMGPAPPGSEAVEREILINLLPGALAAKHGLGERKMEQVAGVAAVHAAAHHDSILVDVVAAARAAASAQRRQLLRALRVIANARGAYDRHDPLACISNVRRAVALLKRSRYPLVAITALIGGSCSYLQGRLDDSARWTAEAHRLALAQTKPSPLLLGQVAWLEGLLAYARGRPAEALAAYERARDELISADDGPRAASVHNLLGGVYGYFGRSTAAWQEATRATRTPGLTPARRYLVLQTLSSLVAEAHLPRLERELASALSLEADRVGDPSFRADALAFQARASLHLGNRATAVEYLRDSLELAKAIKEPHARARTSAYATVELAGALLPERPSEVESLLAPVEPLAASDGELFLDLALARARARELLGDSEGAENDLRRAAARASEDRLPLAGVLSRDEAFARRRDIYAALVESLVNHGRPADALEVLEGWRAESFGHAAQNKAPNSSQLPPADSTVDVFSLLSLPHQLLVWRLHKASVSLARYEVPQDRVTAVVEAFATDLRNGDAASPAGRELSGWILSSREDLPVKVVVVPDAIFFGIPFGALPAPEGTAPLLGEHEFTVVPSLHLWHSIRRTQTRPRPCALLIAGAANGGA
ncbi:MAG TPA: hypothetical protein VGS57_04755, partial [Thermoanaerobaculia bacterium]|nr:hypothetical protein [Thermoanaerobaculia bacterium]